MAAGVFALGFLVFTLMLKVAVPITLGELQGARDEAEPEFNPAAVVLTPAQTPY